MSGKFDTKHQLIKGAFSQLPETQPHIGIHNSQEKRTGVRSGSEYCSFYSICSQVLLAAKGEEVGLLKYCCHRCI